MTDEPNGHSADDDNQLPPAFTMPEPVFRSSEGVTPKNRQKDDTSEAATDPDLQTAAALPSDESAVIVSEEPANPNTERIKVIPAQPKAKTGGCALSVMAILLIIVAVLAALIIVLAYFYYSTPPPDPFQ